MSSENPEIPARCFNLEKASELFLPHGKRSVKKLKRQLRPPVFAGSWDDEDEDPAISYACVPHILSNSHPPHPASQNGCGYSLPPVYVQNMSHHMPTRSPTPPPITISPCSPTPPIIQNRNALPNLPINRRDMCHTTFLRSSSSFPMPSEKPAAPARCYNLEKAAALFFPPGKRYVKELKRQLCFSTFSGCWDDEEYDPAISYVCVSNILPPRSSSIRCSHGASSAKSANCHPINPRVPGFNTSPTSSCHNLEKAARLFFKTS